MCFVGLTIDRLSWQTVAMKPNVVSVDLLECGVIVNFSDGLAAFFPAEFLYDHRVDNGIRLLPNEG